MTNFLTNNINYANENIKKELYITSIAGDSSRPNGSGTAGFNGDNQLATNAKLRIPQGVCVDSLGNVYIGDTYTNNIRFIPIIKGYYFGQDMSANYIYSIAGTTIGGFNGDKKLAKDAKLNYPQGVCVDSVGNVYIADTFNNKIRFIPIIKGYYFGQDMSANYIYSIAGTGGDTSAGTYGFNGDTQLATDAKLGFPYGVCVDSIGNVYIADTGNQKIRFIPIVKGNYFGEDMSANYIYSIAGTATGGLSSNTQLAKNAQLKNTYGVCVDSAGNVYIADYENHRIRFIPIIKGYYFGEDMSANYIYSIAGTATGGFSSNTQLAKNAQLYFPQGVCVDSGGNVYISDTGNQKIRFIPIIKGNYFGRDMSANYIYSIAGTATAGFNGDTQLSKNAQLNYPYGVCVDSIGNVYIADTYNCKIRKLYSYNYTITNINNNKIKNHFGQDMYANYIYSIAGDSTGPNGEGKSGFNGDDQLSTNAQLNYPYGVCVDSIGNVYFSDAINKKIRFIPIIKGKYFDQDMSANYIYTIAGKGTGGFNGDNQLATNAQLNGPYGVCVDSGGNVYFSDIYNRKIRFIPIIKGNYFGRDMSANYIYSIAGTGGDILAGTYGFNGDNQLATNAQLRTPYGVCVDSIGNVYFSDVDTHRIRFIPIIKGNYFDQDMSANYIYTIAGHPGGPYGDADGTGDFNGDNQLATNAQLNCPNGVCVDSIGNVYIADTQNQKIRFIPIIKGKYFGQDMYANYIYSIAGDSTGPYGEGTYGFNGDNQLATDAQLYFPLALCIDSIGNVYLCDSENQKIRFIPIINGNYFGQDMYANYIYSIAGDSTGPYGEGTGGFNGDNQLATDAQLSYPYGVCVDSIGNVYIADSENQKIRFIKNQSSDLINNYFGQPMSLYDMYTIAGTGVSGINLDQLATTGQLTTPFSQFVDLNGNVYIADMGNSRIQFIPIVSGNYFGKNMNANWMYTIAGNGTAGFSDQVLATNGQISIPHNVFVNLLGNIYIPDYGNNRIRFIPIIKGKYYGKDMSANWIYTIAGNGNAGVSDEALATSGIINNPTSVFVDYNGNMYIAQRDTHKISFIPFESGKYFDQDMSANWIYTIAGNGTAGFSDQVLAKNSILYTPFSIWVDSNGNIYFTERDTNRIRFIPVSSGNYFGEDMYANYIYTIAGNGTAGFSDQVLAKNSILNIPCTICLDFKGNVYIGERDGHRVRFIAVEDGNYFGRSMKKNYMYTIAGDGTTTTLHSPGVCVDYIGNVYIASRNNHKIHFIPNNFTKLHTKPMASKYIYTIVGDGSGSNTKHVLSTKTGLNYPTDVCLDSNENMYIADHGNHRILFIPLISGTYFGILMTANFTYSIAGNGTAGYVDQVYAPSSSTNASLSQLNGPSGVAVDSTGNVYIIELNNHTLRFIPRTTNTFFGMPMIANYIYTIAGNKTLGAGIQDGVYAPSTSTTASTSRLNNPYGVSLDLFGNIYIADYGNHRIRFIPIIKGNYFNQYMSANYIYTIAGTTILGVTYGYTDKVLSTSGQLKYPYRVCVDSQQNVYIADLNHTIRFIAKTTNTFFGISMTQNYIYTIAGNQSLGSGVPTEVFAPTTLTTDSISQLKTPTGVCVDLFGNVYIADFGNHSVRFIPIVSGTYFGKSMLANYIYTIAGSGSSGFNDQTIAINGKMNGVASVYVDSNQNIYVSDANNNRIRYIFNKSNYNYNFPLPNSGYYIKNQDAYNYNKTIKSDAPF